MLKYAFKHATRPSLLGKKSMKWMNRQSKSCKKIGKIKLDLTINLKIIFFSYTSLT
jgi:hypothetical protein